MVARSVRRGVLTRDTALGEAGFAAISWIGMVFIAMTLLILVSNAIAIQYAQGAVRTAVDEAARHGARLDGTVAECEARAEEVLRGQGGLLRGTMGDTISLACAVDGPAMVATATGEFEWWLWGLPGIDVEIEGRSIIEPQVEAIP